MTRFDGLMLYEADANIGVPAVKGLAIILWRFGIIYSVGWNKNHVEIHFKD